MRVSDAVAMITETVEAEGLLLVHDQWLPSVTGLISGGPVSGSWWSHPLANVIYNALGALETRFATCKLVSKKLTLIAPRLWSDLAAVGQSRQEWQLEGLSPGESSLLDRVDSSLAAVLLDQPPLRSAGRRLEERLLVVGDEVHTDSGHHLKGLLSWGVWMRDRDLDRPLPDPETSMASFEQIVGEWDPGRRLLPWPTQTTLP
jgi:hypothetical protein